MVSERNDNIGDWIMTDVDKQRTISPRYGVTFTNAFEPKAWQVIDPQRINLYGTDVAPHTGHVCLFSMQSDGSHLDGTTTDVCNDDWLISPEINGGSTVSFMYGIINQLYSPEYVEVLYSSTTRDREAFKLVETFSKSTLGWELITSKLPEDAKFGIAIRTEMLDESGRMIDCGKEFFSVSDFVPRDLSFGITNANLLYNEGMAEVQNSGFKRRYVGAYEYYCWAPSTIFGLAPKEDEWLTGTEAGYDTPITKKFVKGLVDNAHSMGVGVYTWITGLWNYNIGIQHPEWLQYCANGQPNIYNGGIRRTGIRRMTLKPNIYTEERARIWGEEMADSVDMFGWDGCRWDFSFLPSASNDPFFMDQKSRDWYDNNGVPRSVLLGFRLPFPAS